MNITLPLSLILYPIAAFLVYFPSLNGGAIFDDLDILQNVEKFRWEWRYILIRFRPLTLISYALQKIWPGTMRSLHIVNICLHAINGLIVEQIARTIGFDVGLATLAGLLFVVHPFAANTTGYITGRASLISCGFGLFAAWLILAGWGWLSPLFLFLAVLGKEDAAGFVPLAILLALWISAWVLAIVLGAAAIAVALWARVRIRKWRIGNGDLPMSRIGLPVAHRPMPQAVTVLLETVKRLPLWFVGQGQSPYHGSGIPVPGLKSWLQSICILPLIAVTCAMAPIPMLFVLFGPWLVYLLCPVPDQLAEYRNYSKVAGFALILVSVFNEPWTYPALVWLTAFAYCGAATALYAYHWSDPLTMWQTALVHTSGDPSRAHQEVGAYYKLRGENSTAKIYFQEAIRLNPRLGPAINNLAWILWQENKQKEALITMQLCTERCAMYPLGWEEYGSMLDLLGRHQEAIAAYQLAIDIDPKMARSSNRLGLVAFQAKQLDTAAEWFDKALKVQPEHFEYIYNRAMVFKAQGAIAKAKEWFSRLPQPLPVTREMIHPNAVS